MEIRLVGSRVRDIGYGDERQKPLRRRIDSQAGVLKVVVRDRLSVAGIDQLNSRQGGKIATTLVHRRHKGKSIIGRIAARAVIVRKEKSLASALVNSGDIQRPAQGDAEALPQVAGFVEELSVRA